jgi:hypothetical protein
MDAVVMKEFLRKSFGSIFGSADAASVEPVPRLVGMHASLPPNV